MANTNELSEIIKSRIKSYEKKVLHSEVGIVISVADGIASVSGLEKTQFGELVEFENGTKGMALELEEDFLGIVIFGSFISIKEGSKVKRTNQIAEVPVGDNLLGRIINPLGTPLDGKGTIKTRKKRAIEMVAPGIMQRKSVSMPLETGILSIDSMIPIGKGQRELIIGDRKTGKTAIAIDAIINQKGKNTKCIYVSIGQKNSTLAITVQKLIESDAIKYTTIVAANASDSDAMQYIAPFAATSIGEEWMSNGDDVLIVFDDLSKHAVAYRTVSLLLRRPPGREAYPGDVFYLHSRLLERSGRITEEVGGGSMTALPIIETQAGDISAYIPTNVISITDGQIFLLANAFNSGQRPAVDAGLSVSRVGSAAQTKLMKNASASLKLELANYEEVKSFAEFASDLDSATKNTLERGKKIMELLKQKQYSPLLQSRQAIILFSIKNGWIDLIEFDKISKFKKNLLIEMESNKDIKKLLNKIEKQNDINDEQMNEIESFVRKIIKTL